MSKPSSNQAKEHETSHSPFSSLGHKWQQIRNYAKKASSKEKKKGARKLDISDEELSECIDVEKFRADLEQVIKHLKEEFISNINIRIGTNIELLEVESNGETFLLKDIARLTKKNNLITIDLSDLPGELDFNQIFIDHV